MRFLHRIYSVGFKRRLVYEFADLDPKRKMYYVLLASGVKGAEKIEGKKE